MASVPSWAPYAPKRPVPAIAPRLRWAAHSAQTASSSAPRRADEPANSLSRSSGAAASMTTVSALAASSATRPAVRTTSRVPTPVARRAATARATSCSSGTNSPGPTVYTMTQSTESTAKRSGPSPRPASTRKP